MTVKASVLLPSNGPVEVLPPDACPEDVLNTQGSILSSRPGATSQLFWTSSAYLLSQNNAYCSALSGQLVRGDAVLTAEHSSRATAEAWVKDISSSHDISHNVHRAKPGTQRAPAQTQSSVGTAQCSAEGPRQEPKPPGVSNSTHGGNLAGSLGQCAQWEGSDASQGPEEESLSVPGSSQPWEQPGVGQAVVQQSRAGRVSAAPAQQQQQHLASAASDDCCEPRAKLMWTIVGKATSTSWKEATPGSSAATALLTQASRSSKAFTPWAGASSRQLPASSQSSGIAGGAESAAASSQSAEERSEPRFGCSWAELQPEMVVVIASRAGSAAAAQVMWRAAVFPDHACLKKLRFTSPRVITPFARKLTEGHLCPAATGLPITGLIDKAAKAGNIEAGTAVANFLDSMGMRDDGMVYWKIGARLGDARSQVAVGAAAYSGTCGVIRDSDEAYRWLSRAANRLALSPPTLPNGTLLARAACMLGWLSLDGEATKMDLETAVSWFRLASKCGSRDAEIALGTLLRTGQYGPS